jgi:uncharacterized UPF0160 family protein
MDKKIRIVTHNGTFHADELFAIATLQIFLDGKPYEVIRTRDRAIIESADYVVDVGGSYDHAAHRYDHHQHGGAGTRENGIPYSSFGLVWKHFGEQISGSAAIAHRIDEQMCYPVDMGDNGYDYYGLIRQDVEPLLLQFVVAMFRPTWNTSAPHHDERFAELLVIFRRILHLAIEVEQDNLEGARFVEEAYQQATDKRIIVMDRAYPWHHTLAAHPEPLYVVKPKSVGTDWDVECVRDNPFGFENRKNLPSAWAGLVETDSKLPEVTGVADAVFCHNRCYIAVARSKEGALKLAQLAVEAA